MTKPTLAFRCKPFPRRLAAALCLLFVPLLLHGASEKLPVAAKWGRFEQTLWSTVAYDNPLQDCTLAVTFTSPEGATTRVYGFWDGGRAWRVRFSPGQVGRWTFQTSCSDTANAGLHNKSGAFLCTSVTGESRFQRHGPVRVSRDGRRFQHEDGTPFLWLADAAWNAARAAEPREWQRYADIRAGQKFSAVQWSAAPGTDSKEESAFSGAERIAVHPKFFQRLDTRIETLNRAGLLSVIAPLIEIRGQALIPDEQAVLLLRYMVARWGADDVAWLVAFQEGGAPADLAAIRWRRIGRAVFGEAEALHGPVILFPGDLRWVSGAFRDEKWVDALGFGTGANLDEDSVQWLLSGPLTVDWKAKRPLPLLNVSPPLENGVAAAGGARITADDTRQAAWRSLLGTPPAGVTYGAESVANWDKTTDVPGPATLTRPLPLWHRSLFLPGAKQIAVIDELSRSQGFWQLLPAPTHVGQQHGSASPRSQVVMAAATSKDLGVAYVPGNRTVELEMRALPASPVVNWINPRTGARTPAVAVVGTRTCQFPTPDPADWLLVISTTK